MERLGSLIRFLNSVGLLQISLHLVWCCLLVCCILLLLYLSMSLEYLIFLRLLSWMDGEFFQMLFSVSNEMTIFFFFEFDYVVEYIDGFLYIEAYQHLWYEAYWIVVNDSFDVFLDSVGKSFIIYFYIDIHRRNCSEVLLLCLIFVWFCHQCNCGFIEWVE